MYGDVEKLDDNLIVAAGRDGDIFIVQADDKRLESALLLTREQALKLREFITKQEEESDS